MATPKRIISLTYEPRGNNVSNVIAGSLLRPDCPREVFDVALNCSDGVKLNAVKAFISLRSPFFFSTLCKEFKESDTAAITLPFASDFVKEVLTFIYSEDCPAVQEVLKYLSENGAESREIRQIKRYVAQIVGISIAADYVQVNSLTDLCLETLTVCFDEMPKIGCFIATNYHSHKTGALRDFDIAHVSATVMQNPENYFGIAANTLVRPSCSFEFTRRAGSDSEDCCFSNNGEEGQNDSEEEDLSGRSGANNRATLSDERSQSQRIHDASGDEEDLVEHSDHESQFSPGLADDLVSPVPEELETIPGDAGAEMTPGISEVQAAQNEDIVAPNDDEAAVAMDGDEIQDETGEVESDDRPIRQSFERPEPHHEKNDCEDALSGVSGADDRPDEPVTVYEEFSASYRPVSDLSADAIIGLFRTETPDTLSTTQACISALHCWVNHAHHGNETGKQRIETAINIARNLNLEACSTDFLLGYGGKSGLFSERKVNGAIRHHLESKCAELVVSKKETEEAEKQVTALSESQARLQSRLVSAESAARRTLSCVTRANRDTERSIMKLCKRTDDGTDRCLQTEYSAESGRKRKRLGADWVVDELTKIEKACKSSCKQARLLIRSLE